MATLPFEVAWRLLGVENVVQAIGLRNVAQQGDLVEAAGRIALLVAWVDLYKKMPARPLFCPGFFSATYLVLSSIQEFFHSVPNRN